MSAFISVSLNRESSGHGISPNGDTTFTSQKSPVALLGNNSGMKIFKLRVAEIMEGDAFCEAFEKFTPPKGVYVMLTHRRQFAEKLALPESKLSRERPPLIKPGSSAG